MLIQPLTPEILEKRRVFRRKILGLPRRFWRKTRRGLLWTLAIGFVAHSALNIYASVLLNRELSAIRQKGEPLQFAEMAPPDVPDSQNAALLYKAAFDSLRVEKGGKGSLNFVRLDAPPKITRVVEEVARRNQKTVILTRRAALMPQCRFPNNWKTNDPLGLRFPHYTELRKLSLLLSAQAIIAARQGDKSGALRDVRALFGISHHLGNEPVYIGFLVAQAIDNLGHLTLSQVLESVPLSPGEARAFQSSLPASDWRAFFHRSMLGERCWTIYAFESVRNSGTRNIFSDGVSPIWDFRPFIWLWRPVLQLDEVCSLRLWKRQLNAATNPRIAAFARLNPSFDQDLRNAPRYAFLTRLLYPIFGRAGVFRDAAEIRSSQREIALALAVFRTQNGHYPIQLSKVGKTLPLDLYSQKPFVYRLDKNGKGFTLSSVGTNRKDDGGQGPSFGPGASLGDDIVWGQPKR